MKKLLICSILAAFGSATYAETAPYVYRYSLQKEGSLSGVVSPSELPIKTPTSTSLCSNIPDSLTVPAGYAQLPSGVCVRTAETGPTAYNAQVAVTPSVLDFGASGGSPVTRLLSVSNVGGSGTLTVNGITTSPDQGSAVTANYSQCAALETGKSCTVSVTYTPGGTPLTTADLVVKSSAGDSPAIKLTTSGAITVSPTSINFGNVGVSSPSTRAVTITNVSATPVNVSGISVLPSGSPITADTAPCASIAANASCTLNLTYSPTSNSAALAASITVNSSAGPSKTIAATASTPYPVKSVFVLPSLPVLIGKSGSIVPFPTFSGTPGPADSPDGGCTDGSGTQWPGECPPETSEPIDGIGSGDPAKPTLACRPTGAVPDTAIFKLNGDTLYGYTGGLDPWKPMGKVRTDGSGNRYVQGTIAPAGSGNTYYGY